MNLQSCLDDNIYYIPDQIDLVCDTYFEENIVKSKKPKDKCLYYNIPLAFDIETTSFYNDGEKASIMYEWTLGICGGVVIGRTWKEFLETINYIKERYSINKNKILVIYVHNLSFEFQFIRKLFEWENVFALDTRKVVYARTETGIEFRCSYVLTNYSLDNVGKNLMKYHCKKMIGDLDYTLKRHSKTPLTDKEIQYCINDVKVVMACIQEKIEMDGNITLIPLTNTGYVRKYCKKMCMSKENKKEYRKRLSRLTLTEDTYKLLRRAFAGGFTHADALYMGKTLENVASHDETSAYPAAIVSEMYPMSRPKPLQIKTKKEFEWYLDKCCCIFDIELHNIKAKKIENPLSLSHCWEHEKVITNNGRIVSADMIKTTITDIDYKLYEEYYSWETMKIANFHYFYKNYLPTPFISSVLDLYQKKTTLKGVKGSEVEYQVSKGMLNSCYGMMVTDIMRDNIIYTEDCWTIEEIEQHDTLEKYNNSWNRFLYYAWGVWITAYARKNLFEAITELGDDYIYADTDSVKYLNYKNHEKFFVEYNKRLEKKLELAMEYHQLPMSLVKPKTIKGKECLLGAWDFEGVYSKFKTLGAKRYMVEHNGELEITIAGVSKKSGKKYMEMLDDPWESFNDNLIIPADYTGKLIHTYIDYEINGSITDYLGEEYNFTEQSGIHLESTDYSLSIAQQYLDYILSLNV